MASGFLTSGFGSRWCGAMAGDYEKMISLSVAYVAKVVALMPIHGDEITERAPRKVLGLPVSSMCRLAVSCLGGTTCTITIFGAVGLAAKVKLKPPISIGYGPVIAGVNWYGRFRTAHNVAELFTACLGSLCGLSDVLVAVCTFITASLVTVCFGTMARAVICLTVLCCRSVLVSFIIFTKMPAKIACATWCFSPAGIICPSCPSVLDGGVGVVTGEQKGVCGAFCRGLSTAFGQGCVVMAGNVSLCCGFCSRF